MFEIKLVSNTRIPEKDTPHYQWEEREMSPEQLLVWRTHGILALMIPHRVGVSPQECFGAVAAYEEAFNLKPSPYQPVRHIDPVVFMEGLAAMIGVGLIRVEIKQDRYAHVTVPEQE